MATTFRAMVMLAVLVGLPAAWIHYGPLPAGAQRVVDRVLATVNEAVGWGQDSSEERWVRVAPAQSAPQPRAKTVVPAAHQIVAPPALLAPEPAPTKTSTLADRVDPLLARLRQLGAIEYALEHWGEGGKLYRFRCEMPVGATPLTQQFEAVTADPQKSIEQVLAEVSSWQLAHQTSGM